jgi:hypothetical protein
LRFPFLGSKMPGAYFWRRQSMRIVGLDILDAFRKKHADARRPLNAWQTDVEYSTWLSPQDIKDKYASVDFLSGNRAIFNIKGNAYRLVVAVRYRNGLVVIDWVGTHAEYSKQNFRD